MMLSRRIPRAMPGRTNKPSESGPRWAMALHIAPRRRRASSADSSMPANPAMPHISGSPQRPPPDSRRSSRSCCLGSQHVRRGPECTENEIENGQPGIGAEESRDETADDRPLEPPYLNDVVIRLEAAAATSHEPEYRADQAQPKHEPGTPSL